MTDAPDLTDPAELARTVQWLRDKALIEALPQRYAHGLDTRQFDKARAVFRDDCTVKGSLGEYGGHAIRSYFTLTPDVSWLPLIFPGDVRDFNVDDDNFTIERDGKAFSLLFDLYSPPATNFVTATKPPAPNIGTETKVDRSIAPAAPDLFGQ